MSRAVVTCSSSGRPEALRNMRGRHAELARLLRHQPGEPLLAAGDVLGDGHGHVVGALGDQRLDGVDEGDLLALLEVELGGRRRRGVGGDLDLGLVAEPALLDQLEQPCRASSSWPARRDGAARRRRSGAGRGRCWRRPPARRCLPAACAGRRSQRSARRRPARRQRRDAERRAMAVCHAVLNRHSLSVQRRCCLPRRPGDVPVSWASPFWGVFEAAERRAGALSAWDKSTPARGERRG